MITVVDVEAIGITLIKENNHAKQSSKEKKAG